MFCLIIDGTNDMEYIGQTTRSVEERFKAHMKSDYYIGKIHIIPFHLPLDCKVPEHPYL